MKSLRKILCVAVLLSTTACSIPSKGAKPDEQPVSLATLPLKSVTLAELQTKQVNLTKAIRFLVSDYLKATDFRNTQQWRTVFRKDFQKQFLTKPPIYQEEYQETADRLVVTRTLVLHTKDPCDTKMSSKFISLCFQPKSGELNSGVRKGLAGIRKKIKQGIDDNTVDEAKWQPVLNLSDNDMLDYLLNRQTTVRRITGRSVVPYVAYQLKGLKHQKVHNLMPLSGKGQLSKDRPVLQRLATPELIRLYELSVPEDSTPAASTGQPLRFDNQSTFEKKYVMGETFGRSYSDVYELEFAGETLLTDRYYVSFTYDVTFGFGLRFPFKVEGESVIDKVFSGEYSRVVDYPATELCAEVDNVNHADRCAKRAKVNIKATALEANEDFYRSAGVPTEQLFDGKEFVLELGASCALRASIPGPNLGPYRCPKDIANLIDESREFSSQLGERPVDLVEILLSGRSLGLALDAGIGYAAINPGAVLQAHDGIFKLDFAPFNSSLSLTARQLELDGGTRQFFVSEDVAPAITQPWGFQIDNPDYKMNAQLVPRVEVEIGVDLGVYDWNTTFGPYDLDSLAIDFGSFNFDAHSGVRERQRITLARRDNLRNNQNNTSLYTAVGTNCQDNQVIVNNWRCKNETFAVTSDQCQSIERGERLRINNGEITSLGLPQTLQGLVEVVNCNDHTLEVSNDCTVCDVEMTPTNCTSSGVQAGDVIQFTGDIQWNDRGPLRCTSANSQINLLH